MMQSLWFFGSYLTILADRTTTGGQNNLIEGYSPPGSQTPPHLHTRYSEQLYVLEGEFTVFHDSTRWENCSLRIAGKTFSPTGLGFLTKEKS